MLCFKRNLYIRVIFKKSCLEMNFKVGKVDFLSFEFLIGFWFWNLVGSYMKTAELVKFEFSLRLRYVLVSSPGWVSDLSLVTPAQTDPVWWWVMTFTPHPHMSLTNHGFTPRWLVYFVSVILLMFSQSVSSTLCFSLFVFFTIPPFTFVCTHTIISHITNGRPLLGCVSV